MAKIGEQLLQPEAGWKRYDSSDKNINYCKGEWYYYAWSKDYSGEKPKSIAKKTGEENFKFNFTGNKIRIYMMGDNNQNTSNEVYIDGEKYTTLKYNEMPDEHVRLAFEVLNLKGFEHFVDVKIGESIRIYFDAIDIDEKGILKPYNPNLFKYLIKQNNNYYFLKSSIYPLGLPKNNEELEDWYKEYGIDDLNTLVEKKNGKVVDLKLDKNDIYKTVITIDFNEITDGIEYIDEDNKKEIEYNTEEYQLLDLVKKHIGSEFQIGKWEEK